MAVLAALLALGVPAHAQWKSADSKLLPDSPSRKHAGTFSAMLRIAAEDGFAGFMHEWRTTPVAHAPSLRVDRASDHRATIALRCNAKSLFKVS